jgi:transposase-like protein
MGYDPALKAQAVQMCLEGMSFRGVGRTLGVNFQSVINWFNAAHDQLPHQVEDTSPAENVEIDELFTYVGKKQASLRCDGGGQGEQAHSWVLCNERA